MTDQTAVGFVCPADHLHGGLKLVKVDVAIFVLVVFLHQSFHQFHIASKLLRVGPQDGVELLPLNFAVPVQIEAVEDETQILQIGNDGLVDTAGEEFVVVYFAVAVCVNVVHQFLDVRLGNGFPFFLQDERVELVNREVPIVVTVNRFEDLAQLVHFALGQMS